jgi:hypothetical protein
MDENQSVSEIYLNRENLWLDFQSEGLDLNPDGTLRLAALPRLADEVILEAPQGSELALPAGLAVDPCGAVYYSLPDSSRLGELRTCEPRGMTPASLPGEGRLPGWLSEPRGLLFHPMRKALFVADSGNSRIQIFDPRT